MRAREIHWSADSDYVRSRRCHAVDCIFARHSTWAARFFPQRTLFFAFIAIFGGAFLMALRRLSILRSRALRFAVPMLCTIALLFCSYVAGGYIGDRLNTAVFHMPVQDFDK